MTKTEDALKAIADALKTQRAGFHVGSVNIVDAVYELAKQVGRVADALGEQKR